MSDCIDKLREPCYYRLPLEQCGRGEGVACLHSDRIAALRIHEETKEKEAVR